MSHFRIWFSRHGGVGWMVGLDDLRGLFQPMILRNLHVQEGFLVPVKGLAEGLCSHLVCLEQFLLPHCFQFPLNSCCWNQADRTQEHRYWQKTHSCQGKKAHFKSRLIWAPCMSELCSKRGRVEPVTWRGPWRGSPGAEHREGSTGQWRWVIWWTWQFIPEYKLCVQRGIAWDLSQQRSSHKQERLLAFCT